MCWLVSSVVRLGNFNNYLAGFKCEMIRFPTCELNPFYLSHLQYSSQPTKKV